MEGRIAARACDALSPLLQKCGIATTKGKLPRIHDLRHSFAVNALLRWYRAGADVEVKLPLLATYLGHGSAVSTHYYLHFIEPLRTGASERFAKHYGALISPPAQVRGGGDENRASQSPRCCHPRLFYGSPPPASRNQSTHHPKYRDSIILLLRFLPDNGISRLRGSN